MIKSKKVLSLVLALITLISVWGFSTSANAANTTDTAITQFGASFFYYTYHTPARLKQDWSPVYVYITDGKRDRVYVRAYGTNNISASTKVNETVDPDISSYPVDHVTCYRGIEHSVHSYIYEDDYDFALLGFRCPNVLGDEISGWWSPDSALTHTDAHM
ncbi:MAG: hypothetical protein IJM90_05020 [Firmicutes bacterium]|nr:hypothetical protein [Bacillota bacterium]